MLIRSCDIISRSSVLCNSSAHIPYPQSNYTYQSNYKKEGRKERSRSRRRRKKKDLYFQAQSWPRENPLEPASLWNSLWNRKQISSDSIKWECITRTKLYEKLQYTCFTEIRITYYNFWHLLYHLLPKQQFLIQNIYIQNKKISLVLYC